jgi:2-amino-4-hydroxy-6-hydroxymethyldihydropteridine diphosphokinase
MARVAVALGSNLGDRDEFLNRAAESLRPFISDLRLSSFYRTAPVGVGEQPEFLNAAAVGESVLSARALLETLLAIEQRYGRQRPHPGAARTLDLDLILYGDAVIDEPPTLIVPHPRFRERRFVLEPLAEVAPDWTDPATGLTIARLLEKLSDVERGHRSDPLP